MIVTHIRLSVYRGDLPIDTIVPFSRDTSDGWHLGWWPRSQAYRIHTVNARDKQGAFEYYIEAV